MQQTKAAPALSDEQVAEYRRRGYVAVEGALDAAAVAEAVAVLDEFVERSRALTVGDDVFDLEPGHSAERPALRRLKNPERQHPVFDGLMRHERILDMVERLIGPDIRFMAGKLNVKAADVGSPVEWHQDYAFGPTTNDDTLTVGIHLDDSDEENGCLLVIPGSHRGPVLDHHHDGQFVGAVRTAEVDTAAAAPIVLRAGGVSLHHARMLHASAPNRSPRPRRLLLFQYGAADALPIGPNPVAAGLSAKWDEWDRDIVRGRPSRIARLMAFEAPMPVYVRTGSIYELQEEAQ
jgi:ectoine hydroxylase-related dioxygenase (phytanoyl-CoA dioxygenase family)